MSASSRRAARRCRSCATGWRGSSSPRFPTPPSALDHVVLAVDDLDRAAARLEREHGLASYAGGRHARGGTANRIVPLGSQYLELMAVVDPARAEGWGRLVAEL